ncbi:ankyrin repeat-containing domain protein [Geopyxis carbonaria]|nr:ankyrin repeat-containing domain protein [Geopyxis carbonaria]
MVSVGMHSSDTASVEEETDIPPHLELVPEEKTAKELTKSLDWLNSSADASPEEELSKHQNQYTPHTGQWLPSTTEYTQLFKSPVRGLLWIHGSLGSGKSVIAARLIQQFLQAGGGGVCYCFVRGWGQREMAINGLKQLFPVSAPLRARLLALHSENPEWGTVDMAKIWSVFSDAAAEMASCRFVVDGLDQMDPGGLQLCLRDLVALARRHPQGVKIIITSRHSAEIEDVLRGYEGSLTLQLDREKVDRDISWYASQRLQDSADATHLDEAAREGLVRDLVARADGLFLYAKLALDDLLADSSSSSRNLSTSLSALPCGISEMYAYLLSKHRAESGHSLEQQVLVLQAVMFSMETPSLLILASMLHTGLGEPGLEVARAGATGALQRICGALLEIRDDRVQLLHHSLAEFLTNTLGMRGATRGSFPVLTARTAHRVLCALCLSFLNLSCWQEKDDDPMERNDDRGDFSPFSRAKDLVRTVAFSFLNYALDHWGAHARLGMVNDEAVFAQMTAHLEAQVNVYTKLRGYGIAAYPRNFTPLHIAAGAGLAPYVRHLLSRGADVEARDSYGCTPLAFAARGGWVVVCSLLAAHGAELEAHRDIRGWTPLHHAAHCGHPLFVRRLLELGVAANPEGFVYCHLESGCYPQDRWTNDETPAIYTPLRLAILHNHVAVVVELLPHLTPEDALFSHPNGSKGKTALHYAASRDRATIVGLLLISNLAAVDSTDHAGRTPLLRAVQEDGTAQTVEVLLSHGADPLLANPLHACVSFSEKSSQRYTLQMVAMAAALVAGGADPNARDAKGNTPLFVCKHGKLLEWLLQNGADAQMRNDAGQTPLHWVETTDMAKCLIAAGVDVNAQDKQGNTPLMAHSRFGRLWTFTELFARHGGNLYIPNHAGETAIFSRLSARWITFGNRAERHGIDLAARDRFGRTLLHYGFQEGHPLPAGIDVDAQDCYGNTALHTVDSIGQIGRLLDAGASAAIKNRAGQAPIHALIARADSCRFWLRYAVRLLLSHHDADLRDADGNTAWLLAANCGLFLEPTDAVLWTHGVDVAARNYDGRNALHLAAMGTGDLAIALKYLPASVVHETDAKGCTPLHYAAASGAASDVQTLLNEGATAAPRTLEGRTPLHFAAASASANAVYILAEQMKSQPQSLDTQGYTGITALAEAACVRVLRRHMRWRRRRGRVRRFGSRWWSVMRLLLLRYSRITVWISEMMLWRWSPTTAPMAMTLTITASAHTSQTPTLPGKLPTLASAAVCSAA